jgi:hypothetical protein
MVEAIFTIIGTIIGFALSEVATAIRECRGEKRRTRSVKTLLKLEMTLNLQGLRDFWTKVSTLPEAQEDLDSQKRALARQLIEEPIPQFERGAFESQLSHLASALEEHEVLQVLQFYDRLRRLESIRAEFIESLSEQQQELQAAAPGAAIGDSLTSGLAYYLLSRLFNEKAPRLWDEVELLVNQILAKGNPFDSES